MGVLAERSSPTIPCAFHIASATLMWRLYVQHIVESTVHRYCWIFLEGIKNRNNSYTMISHMNRTKVILKSLKSIKIKEKHSEKTGDT